MATLLVALPTAVATAQDSGEAFASHIQVNGRAEREVTPDRFTLQITIAERDSKGRISVEEQLHTLIDVLKKLGIDPEKELKASDNSSEFFRKKQSLSTARYELELNSATTMQHVWRALSELNLSEIRLIRAEYSRMEEIRSEMRREAMLNARQTAEELASAIGQQVGKCFYIVDWNNESTPRLYDNALVMRTKATFEEEAAQEEIALDFRSTRLTYSVQTKFILE